MYAIPSLREAKATQQKEFDNRAKTAQAGKFSMLNVMADDAKKKADALKKHQSAMNKSAGPAMSMLSQKYMSGSKPVEKPAVNPNAMLKGLGQRLLGLGEKKAQKVARLK